METKTYSDPNKLLDDIPIEGVGFPYHLWVESRAFSDSTQYNIKISLETYKLDRATKESFLIQRCNTNLSCGFNDKDAKTFRDGQPIKDLIKRMEDEFDLGNLNPMQVKGKTLYTLKGLKNPLMKDINTGDQIPLFY